MTSRWDPCTYFSSYDIITMDAPVKRSLVDIKGEFVKTSFCFSTTSFIFPEFDNFGHEKSLKIHRVLMGETSEPC